MQAITDALKAFTVEFEKLHALRHGNVLRLMARVKDEMALITEYCERGSLHEVLHGKSAEKEKEQEKPKAIMVAECPLPLERAWSILLQLADAMLFLHSQPQPIVHRDVKSGNCLVTTAWTLKLADFDMARTQLATIGQLGFRCGLLLVVMFSVVSLFFIRFFHQDPNPGHLQLQITRAVRRRRLC